MAFTITSDSITTELKHLYHTYRSTENLTARAAFFSPTCMQACRPMPAYAAKDRDTIMAYVYQADGFKDAKDYDAAQLSPIAPESISLRPLTATEENEILPEEVVAPLDMTPTEVDDKRRKEGWAGLYADIVQYVGDGKGQLIKVKYWWRKEMVDGKEKWMQCFHDIVSIGESANEATTGKAVEYKRFKRATES